MTNKVNMEEIIAYNMKAKSYCPYDLSVLRMPINICTEEQSFLTYESWRCFFTAKDLQEAWPVLKSALKEYGISCALDLAVKVLNGMPCYLVYTGYVFDGFCQKFDIKRDKYVFRKKTAHESPGTGT
ncbi:hypothetical protein PRUPE_6G351800 [Prunus persica]|uniref:Uncharacterized protein n=1 Tax=Prunus persica TaxID=3760 RepID=A0A251P0C0_PRUPE|nr:uncharacterized protein LOC109949772 isoform X3 [Prunus persica]ONI05019.1 hypothetical protein PRUPE_6G351800 [Prunus persica]ONI05020.1 hypothetical protein PRUPE_6G351800 [Prunus persica]